MVSYITLCILFNLLYAFKNTILRRSPQTSADCPRLPAYKTQEQMSPMPRTPLGWAQWFLEPFQGWATCTIFLANPHLLQKGLISPKEKIFLTKVSSI